MLDLDNTLWGGIVGDDEVKYLRECGVDGFLIGRAFMEADDPKAAALHWKELFA